MIERDVFGVWIQLWEELNGTRDRVLDSDEDYAWLKKRVGEQWEERPKNDFTRDFMLRNLIAFTLNDYEEKFKP